MSDVIPSKVIPSDVNKNKNRRKTKDAERWKIMYSNVRGLRAKRSSLIEILNEENPQIFLLTETQLKSNSSISIKGYTFFGKPRPEKCGGGIGILVRNDIRGSVAAHTSTKNIELMWISIKRKNCPPIFIATYYGKQESASKDEIENEFELLSEELKEMEKDGELFLAMDGNAKLGLLGEEISRNGKILERVIEENDLVLINSRQCCKGKITRKNTKNEKEVSAIDFILTSQTAAIWVKEMIIDEEGTLKVKGKTASDHNTITVKIEIKNIDQVKSIKRVNWNLKASPLKWNLFKAELRRRNLKAAAIMFNLEKSFQLRYKEWYREIENAAMKSIGKTTTKEQKGKEQFSDTVKKLREKKKQVKDELKKTNDIEIRKKLTFQCKIKQEQIRNQILLERKEKVARKFQKIASDRSKSLFWREKRKMSRNSTLEWMVTKNEEGKRLYGPQENINNALTYFKKLFKKKEMRPHSYHEVIKKKMKMYEEDRNYEFEEQNDMPSIKEIAEIISNKKNGKSTSDIKNEILKRTGDEMVDFLWPMIFAVWNEEEIPGKWNEGLITSIWKGRGDMESLKNHRGITVSSAIGTIVEEILDNRIEKKVLFTQAQAGGQKGLSTCDHIFIIRAIISIAKKQKRNIFLTYYDVEKAYDNVDVDNMLVILWERGFRGKAWRILKNLSKNLTSKVKTRFGVTKPFEMEIGGRQGSRLTGRLFSKQMDVLSEEMMEKTSEALQINDNLRIGALLYVDDVVSSVEGVKNQERVLTTIDNFAIRNKVVWGSEKCKVMQIGQQKDDRNVWQLGEKEIGTCKEYKYLGDVISYDGKNKANIEARCRKIHTSTRNINTIGGNEVMRGIEASVLLELHEKINVPSLITNSETWILSKYEEKEIDKIEIKALKRLFSLPTTTPTPAVIFAFGILYTTCRIHEKQFLFLQKLLKRNEEHWTKRLLIILFELNIGWSERIIKKLEEYNLETDMNKIKDKTVKTWKKEVKQAVEKQNNERLLESCFKIENGEKKMKTKTASIPEQLNKEKYSRKPSEEILNCNRTDAKVIILARYGMLECGKNYRGSLPLTCAECDEGDDENHRMNYCTRWKKLNLHDENEKIDFQDIHSHDQEKIMRVVLRIKDVWNVRTANGTMNIIP